jgi:uncharacterized cofD-like protein
LSNLLRGLKHQQAEIAALVAVSDDGGSSGRLRTELGALPPGDIRNCMLALSEDEALLSRLFRYRFTSIDAGGGLDDHSFGNLFLTALADLMGDFAEAVRMTSEVLAIRGTIYPVTTANVRLRAVLDDGETIEGETRISADRRRIRRLELDPFDADAHPEALEAIATADVITLGPGSLYTSLIAALLPRGVVEAIEASSARKIYIQNIMTQPVETIGLTMADHLQAIADHCGGTLFPTAIVNSGTPPAALLRKYAADDAYVVEVDRDRVASLGVDLIELPLLAAEDGPGSGFPGGHASIRHDPELLARAVLDVLSSSLASSRMSNRSRSEGRSTDDRI